MVEADDPLLLGTKVRICACLGRAGLGVRPRLKLGVGGVYSSVSSSCKLLSSSVQPMIWKSIALFPDCLIPDVAEVHHLVDKCKCVCNRAWILVLMCSSCLLSSQGQGYDATRNAEYWATRPVPVTARVLVIGAEMGAWWVRAQLKHRNNPRAAAAELRQVCGPGPMDMQGGQWGRRAC
jgi:hypothetical protein